jgi:hypothetical protein
MGFIGSLKLITTNTYSSFANLDTVHFNTACTKSLQPILPSLVIAWKHPSSSLCFSPYIIAGWLAATSGPQLATHWL